MKRRMFDRVVVLAVALAVLLGGLEIISGNDRAQAIVTAIARADFQDFVIATTMDPTPDPVPNLAEILDPTPDPVPRLAEILDPTPDPVPNLF